MEFLLVAFAVGCYIFRSMENKRFNFKILTVTNTGLKNTPSIGVGRNLYLLGNNLEVIEKFIRKTVDDSRRIRVNSAYRSKDVNSAVGGSSTSSHLTGLAADISCENVSLDALMTLIVRSGVKFDQLILEPGWVHVGFGSKLRGQILRMSGGKYFPYTVKP